MDARSQSLLSCPLPLLLSCRRRLCWCSLPLLLLSLSELLLLELLELLLLSSLLLSARESTRGCKGGEASEALAGQPAGLPQRRRQGGQGSTSSSALETHAPIHQGPYRCASASSCGASCGASCAACAPKGTAQQGSMAWQPAAKRMAGCNSANWHMHTSGEGAHAAAAPATAAPPSPSSPSSAASSYPSCPSCAASCSHQRPAEPIIQRCSMRCRQCRQPARGKGG